MKKNVSLFLFLLFLPAIVSAQSGETKDLDGNLQSQIDLLNKKIINHEVTRVEIIQIPPYIMTRARITPNVLEKAFTYKFTISDIRGGTYRSGFVEAIQSVKVSSEKEMTDLRWGVVLYDMNEKRMGAIYFDKTGNKGAFGDAPVSFKGGFFSWLNNNFSSCFR